MEDQAQKMEALKKVYAEIVLNTEKEAAARAMASECKARRFHHDLRNTKDEALRMLLRFKQMIDVKTTEAQTTALSQQTRIDKLDTQLNETEGVIMDLRAEIRKSRERLEEMKNSHMLESDGQSENAHMHQENTDVTEQFRCNPDKEITTLDPNLASIIAGKNEPELYRNGYTHRIRAIETNLVNENNAKSTESNEKNVCTLRRSIRKRKVRCWDEISSLFKSRPSLSQCKKYPGNNDVKFEGTKYEDTELVKDLAVEKLEGAAKESLGTACGADNKCLKYTFSRRRKKVQMSQSFNCSSLGTSSLTSQMREKPCYNLENQKPNLIEDLSSDNQNIIDIACQLISLSEVRSR